MSYAVKTILEPGYADMRYVRIEPLGTSGLVKEELIGVSMVRLAEVAGETVLTHMLAQEAFAERLLGGTPEVSSPDEEIPDLESFVDFTVARWSELSRHSKFGRALTILTQDRTPKETRSQGDVTVLNPELAANISDEFLRNRATPDETEAIDRITAHITSLLTQREEPVPGLYL